MAKKVLVIGSGASAVHFALSVLQKGYEVVMLDVGYKRPQAVYPSYSLNTLKTVLDDPADYFLGENFEAVVYPDSAAEYYGFPPNKTYVFANAPGFAPQARGFAPLWSFAQGGLAEAWTGGVYPFTDAELQDFPFDYKDIEPFYNEVARRIGVSGINDDLGKFLPLQESLLAPLELDEHSALLLAEYHKQRDVLNRQLSCYFGRARIATLSRRQHDREPCSYLGRCLWGCPSQAFYTPSITLRQCQRFANFHYVPGVYVSHFTFNAQRRITAVVAQAVQGTTRYEWPVETLVLAAGTLSSSRIFMESILQHCGEVITLRGLTDNRQVLIPFVNLKMLGKAYNPDTYQYHQIAFGIEREKPQEYIHGLITTLKTGLMHPIVQRVPLNLKTALYVFRHVHAALGLVNLNFHDHRREDNYLTLEINRQTHSAQLLINYAPEANERASIKAAISKVKRVLWRLKCVVPPGMIHVRPMGASVHYAGTLPMRTRPCTYTTSASCQSHDFANLYIVDGTTFPFLPAKNITFTLMANAIRVAECAF
jgi:choline dehydrogenase-like flavoprotein